MKDDKEHPGKNFANRVNQQARWLENNNIKISGCPSQRLQRRGLTIIKNLLK